LAVVHAADDVADATMLAFARETRLSETTFVQAATDAGASYRNRIWMPTGELPFAGHPSLGTAVAVAAAEGRDAASYVQQTTSGLTPIEVERTGEHWHAAMLQAPVQLGAELDGGELLAAVGLDPGAAHPELPAQVASTGTPHALVPVASADVLAAPRPADLVALRALMERHGTEVVYAFALLDEGRRARARSWFCDVGFVNEDPATGSAAGPLAGYLAARGLGEAIVVEQGIEMGRPSLLSCAVQGDRRIEVAGDCVIVATGTVILPTG
jgi:trans-2,3-dihydro-3-hydroxyanthranilate isomerase